MVISAPRGPSSGICTPSRFALLTGQHHWRRFHGIVGAYGGTVFEPGEFTIAGMFKKKGYRTACFGKWHLGWDFEAIRKPGVARKDWVRADSYDWTKRFPGGPTERGAGLTVRGMTTGWAGRPLDAIPHLQAAFQNRAGQIDLGRIKVEEIDT